jgi:hypothetical protein
MGAGTAPENRISHCALQLEQQKLQNVVMRFVAQPMLAALLEIYRIPPGKDRFDAYIKATIAGATRAADVACPPLVLANPMAKDHANQQLETWLVLGAEEELTRILEDVNQKFSSLEFETIVHVGLTLVDDLKGGWTDSILTDWSLRFPEKMNPNWVCVPLWTKYPQTLEILRRNAKMAIGRFVWQAQHGAPSTLREMLAQEGYAQAFAKEKLSLPREDLAYTQVVIEPFLENMNKPTQLAALYGDDAAKHVGYPALGLSNDAGFELALATALSDGLESLG